jgi:hypothetical protein
VTERDEPTVVSEYNAIVLEIFICFQEWFYNFRKCVYFWTQITYLSWSKTSRRQDRTTDSRLETADETMNGELKGGVHKP